MKVYVEVSPTIQKQGDVKVVDAFHVKDNTDLNALSWHIREVAKEDVAKRTKEYVNITVYPHFLNSDKLSESIDTSASSVKYWLQYAQDAQGNEVKDLIVLMVCTYEYVKES